MATLANEFAMDFDVIEQAAARWHKREPSRKQKTQWLKQKRYDAVEPKDRLAKRANRLLAKVRQALPMGVEAWSADLRALVERGPIHEDEIDNDLMERVIGETRDFLAVEFLEKGVRVNRCVGRVVTRLGGGRVSYGTGVLVAPGLLLTNWHVLRSESEAAVSLVEFNYQMDGWGNPRAVQRFQIDPGAFFLNDQRLDYAVAAVQEKSAQGGPLRDHGWSPLIRAEGKAILGNPLNIIQHPRGEMKQIIIRENKLVDLLDDFAHYQGDTEPGSSGSPVFNDEWEVVALHHSGVPKRDEDGNLLDVDGNVWTKGDDPARLAWVANEGIRVSRIVAHIDKAKVREHEKRLRDKLLDPGEPSHQRPGSVAEPGNGAKRTPPPEEAKPATSSALSPSAGAVTLTVPLNITISLGPLGPSQATVSVTRPGEGLLERIEPDPDYSNRPGYDPNFLGFPVPLPKLTNITRGQAVEVPGNGTGNRFEIKYHHYSVLMNRPRRLAFLAAVNLDAQAPFVHHREGSDQWFFDPRIPREVQAGNEFYARNPLDRGHLVRRADAAWGHSEQEAKRANDDTFHFTNCSPQHEVFNQSHLASQRGLRLWGNLENHVAEQARENNKKVCVFNGPVFRANDRRHRGLPIPREFWKMVVVQKTNTQPAALAFVLSQASLIKGLPEEAFEAGEYRPYQIKIRELENRTKLDFGNLRTFDPLEAEGNERFFEADTEAVPLERLADIII